MDFNFYNDLILNINDIREYINSYLIYIFYQDTSLDINEINDYIVSIPEICDYLIEKVNALYEKENK